MQKKDMQIMNSMICSYQVLSFPIPMLISGNKYIGCFVSDYEETRNTLTFKNFSKILLKTGNTYTQMGLFKILPEIKIRNKKTYLKNLNQKNINKYVTDFNEIQEFILKPSCDIPKDTKIKIVKFYDFLQSIVGNELMPYYKEIFNETFLWFDSI